MSGYGTTRSRPRVGFLGVGWIGRNRLEALVRSGVAEVVAVSDPLPENAAAARELAACAAAASLEELLDAGLDGLIIATPSALHSDQAVAALERGVAVFCQKPLGRTEAETARVVAAARNANKLLDVDLSYRHVAGVSRIRELVRSGELGTVYAADLVFHNAYGPDKQWFYDPALSGGGCVIDLGSHLVDLSLWMLGAPKVVGVTSLLFAGGNRLTLPPQVVEDYAIAHLELETGGFVRLACSWNLPAGCDAVIQASFYGTRGGAGLRNLRGSFYDFMVERFRGTSRDTLSAPPDDWGGRAALQWATRLARGEGFDPAAHQLTELAAVLDAIYGRKASPPAAANGPRGRSPATALAGSAFQS